MAECLLIKYMLHEITFNQVLPLTVDTVPVNNLSWSYDGITEYPSINHVSMGTARQVGIGEVSPFKASRIKNSIAHVSSNQQSTLQIGGIQVSADEIDPVNSLSPLA
jgi:hypothetical protein